MMPTRILVMLLLIVVGAVNAAETNRFAVASPKEKATWHLAVHTAARRALESLDKLQKPTPEAKLQMQSQLTDAMLTDITEHQKRETSLAHCRELVNDQWRAVHADSLNHILDVANEQSPLGIDLADVTKVAGTQYQRSLEAQLDAFIEKHMDALFAEARSTAVALNRQLVDRQASSPPFDVIDPLLTEAADKNGSLAVNWSKKTRSHLQTALQPYAGRTDQPVLEEVEAYANAISSQLVARIREQYAQQIAQADKQLTAADENQNAKTAEQIERIAKKALLDALKSKRTNDREKTDEFPVYPLFSAVARHIQRQAKQIEMERFVRFIKNTPVLTIEATELETMIKAEMAAHLEKNTSRALLLSTLRDTRGREMVSSYAESGINANGTAAYFSDLLETESKARRAFQNRLKSGLDAVLADVRNKLADNQYQSAGFALIDATETLPDAALTTIHNSRGQPVDSVDQALRFLDAAKIMVPPSASPRLMDETRHRVIESVNTLIDGANKAIQGQLDCLRELESEKHETLKEDVYAGRELSDIRSEWETTLMQQWTQLATQIKSPYERLTPPATTMLNKTIRQLYDSIRVEQEQQASTEAVTQSDSTTSAVESTAADDVENEEPPKPEETMVRPVDSNGEASAEAAEGAGTSETAGASGDGLADRPLPDILLLLTGVDADTCHVSIVIKDMEVTINQAIDVTEPTTAADSIFSQLAPHLADLHEHVLSQSRDNGGFFRFLKRASAPSLSVHVVVDSDAVRHRMSLLLKRQFETAVQDIEAGSERDAVAIEWQAGLRDSFDAQD